VSSNLDQAASTLAATDQAVQQALQQCSVAARMAEEITQKAMVLGSTGMVVGMNRVRQAINEIRSTITTAHDTTRKAASAVTAVPAQASGEDTVQALAPVTAMLNNLAGSEQKVRGQIMDAMNLVGNVLRGSEPGPLLTTVRSIGEATNIVKQHMGAAQQAVETAARNAATLGTPGN
jgi:hypothetical protein